MDRHAGLGGIQNPAVTETNKEINLDVDGRHPDVQIDIQGRGRGNITFSISGGGGGRKEPYEGPYTVTSESDALQILQTENKVMTENMVVLPIPYSETSNPKGGLTVFIGGD